MKQATDQTSSYAYIHNIKSKLLPSLIAHIDENWRPMSNGIYRK